MQNQIVARLEVPAGPGRALGTVVVIQKTHQQQRPQRGGNQARQERARATRHRMRRFRNRFLRLGNSIGAQDTVESDHATQVAKVGPAHYRQHV